MRSTQPQGGAEYPPCSFGGAQPVLENYSTNGVLREGMVKIYTGTCRRNGPCALPLNLFLILRGNPNNETSFKPNSRTTYIPMIKQRNFNRFRVMTSPSVPIHRFLDLPTPWVHMVHLPPTFGVLPYFMKYMVAPYNQDVHAKRTSGKSTQP